jgi:hypothetical protein
MGETALVPSAATSRFVVEMTWTTRHGDELFGRGDKGEAREAP